MEKISQFIETLVQPHVAAQDLAAAYRDMAADESREAEANEWAEATVQDVADKAR
ncbi:MAG TPA: addiction module antitoxin [Thermoanaerobaculia bacterium]|nr:addiction module antitoxin [Thermoanaerobaculia bacterium]